MCLSDILDDGKPSEVQLHSLPMWVRSYDLPFKGRGSDQNVRMLASKVGTYVRTDKTDAMEIERSIRTRIVVDVRQPLKEEVKLKARGGEHCRVRVKYERIPLFCYICGKLGHDDKDCDEHRWDNSPVKRYGDWLRASPWKVPTTPRDVGDMKGGSARHFFVTKPVNPVVLEVTESIEDVARHLRDVIIEGNPKGRGITTLPINLSSACAISSSEGDNNGVVDITLGVNNVGGGSEDYVGDGEDGSLMNWSKGKGVEKKKT